MVVQLSRTAVLIIIIGCFLGLISALVPFYNTGYNLKIAVLMVGISPYLVYGIAIPFLRGAMLIIPGLLLIAAHAWLVMMYRFTLPVDYSDGWIYYGPLLLAAAVFPLAVRAMRVPYTGGIAPKSTTQELLEREEPSDASQ